MALDLSISFKLYNEMALKLSGIELLRQIMYKSIAGELF